MPQQTIVESEIHADNELSGSTATVKEPLWTVDQVAHYLQLKPETVRAMAREQEIPAIRIRNRYWRFRRQDIEQWVISLTVG